MRFSEKTLIGLMLVLMLMGIGFPTLYSLNISFQNGPTASLETTHEELIAPARTIDFLLDGPNSSQSNASSSISIVLFFSSDQNKGTLRGNDNSIRVLRQYASCRPDRLPSVSLLIFPFHEFA